MIRRPKFPFAFNWDQQCIKVLGYPRYPLITPSYQPINQVQTSGRIPRSSYVYTGTPPEAQPIPNWQGPPAPVVPIPSEFPPPITVPLSEAQKQEIINRIQGKEVMFPRKMGDTLTPNSSIQPTQFPFSYQNNY